MSAESMLMWPALAILVLALPVGRALLRGVLAFLAEATVIHKLMDGGDDEDDD